MTPEEGKSLKSLYRSTFSHSRLPKTGYFCHFWPKSQKKAKKRVFWQFAVKKPVTISTF